MDMNCMEAHKMLVLNQLVCDGRGTEAASKIGELIHLVDRFEPLNHSLYYQLSLPLARVVRASYRKYTHTHTQSILAMLRQLCETAAKGPFI